MRTITRTVNVYTIDELSVEARERALDIVTQWQVDDEWWENLYEDWESCLGIKVTSFDLDHGGDITGKLLWTLRESAEGAVKHWGDDQITHKLGKEYINELDGVPDYYLDSDDDAVRELEREYLHAILMECLKMLKIEYEWKTSEENVLEMIEMNEYEFDENGEVI